MVNSIEKLRAEVETLNGLCYVRDKLNASGGCKAVMAARVRIGWVRFKECVKLSLGDRLSLEV